MARIHGALEDGHNVLFEGACGTGKTLAALAPALQVARAQDKTVVITTNVHQQMRQFVREASEIRDSEPIRAVVFRGKASMCHIDVGYEECQALRDETRELVDVERDVAQLERRQQDLLDAARDGDEEATAARSAVMDELETLQADLRDRREGTVCEHYRRNLTADTDEFFGWLFEGVRDPDDVYEYAEERGLCGYELLKEGMEGVDLVVANYHHLLDATIRQQFFRWLGRDAEDVIAVFDEAHNVESAARDHATRTLAEPTLDAAVDELADADDPRADRAANVVAAFRDALVETYESALRGAVRADENWTDVSVANDDRRDDLTLAFLRRYEGQGIDGDVEAALAVGADLDESYERAYRRGETTSRRDCQTLTAASFLQAYLEGAPDAGRYPVVGVRRSDAGEVYGRAELYTCIPREVTADLFESVHAAVLMSATLRPFDVSADVLGLEDPETMAYGLTFPPERRRTFAVDTPPLFASDRGDPAVQRSVADALRDLLRFTPGSALCFFPSYAEAERYHDLLEDVDATRYLDESGVRAEGARRRFAADDDGALFTSLWGTLSEGVSFDGDDARAVAVVGVPYPHLDDRAEAVQDAYARTFDDHDDAGWRYAVEIPTVRKTRQALGRVLRSPADVGVRALLDRRYTAAGVPEMGTYSVHETFPEEERAEMVDVAPDKLKFALLNFWQDHGAYGGDPPTP
ncbi:MAG: ATP-dependent DNA helicase [Halobacteriaceae archaeon]